MKSLVIVLLLLVSSWAGADDVHPLEGRLWSVQEARFISREALFERLPAGGWLLLGEQHDHPEHHRIQKRWISALAERQALGAVALEMATHDQQPLFDSALGKGKSVTPEALEWNPRWPWSLYAEVVATALDTAGAVAAADLTRDEQRRAYREGAAQGELGEAHAERMRELLYESHCGQLPRDSLDSMRQVQLARDQQMAAVLERYAVPGRVGVMLTGGIHARPDLGIPRWLALPSVSVLMVMVDGDSDPSSYLPDGLPGRRAADYLLFTSALEDKDYCKGLREK
ncbi:MAG TPA: ChaN family lipoprotein [Halomonas sp.]|nr:ChaN family lipoprotein [Halomonas sp.]